MSRAELDGQLEIGAHAHGEICDAVAPGDGGQQREMRRALFIFRRDAHEAIDGEAEASAAIGDEGIRLLRHNARLLRFAPGIDLHIESRPPAGFRHFGR